MKSAKSLLIAIPFFCLGFQAYAILSQFIYVKKNITITLDDNKYSFESNVNKDGDRFFIIMDKDTLGRGVVVNGKWK